MKTIYFDCTGGLSGDMVLLALEQLADQYEHRLAHHHHQNAHAGGTEARQFGHHHRSYTQVKKLIEQGFYSENAKAYAGQIYAVIAKAEAAVHGESLDTVHFHEVGRDRAILNALGIGQALDRMGIDTSAGDRILASAIYDGRGFVDCAHGRIPVPVPAVQAMMDECDKNGRGFQFRTWEDVDTEMVTPSGLASIIGIGAQPSDEDFSAEVYANRFGRAVGAEHDVQPDGAEHDVQPDGAECACTQLSSVNKGMRLIGKAEVTGTRSTGRCLRAYLISEE